MSGVTQEELSAAQDEVEADAETEVAAEETTGEESQEDVDEVLEPPKDAGQNQERSKLGRKLAAMESTVNMEIGEIKQALQALAQAVQGGVQTEEEEYIDTSDPKTFRQEIERYENEKANKQKTYYEKAKAQLIKEGMSVPDEDFEAIYIDAYQSFEQLSNDPKLDAKLAWKDAMARHYQKKASGSPMSKRKPDKPKGGAAGSVNDEGYKEKPKLDDAAADFLKRIGKDDDWAAKALSR